MTARSHARWERLMVRALLSADPVAALRRGARDAALPRDLRRALAGCSADGIRMTALLVAKLRFERLLRASADAEGWFDRDPASFTAAFRAYHRAVPPTAFHPSAEAALWARWRERPPAGAQLSPRAGRKHRQRVP